MAVAPYSSGSNKKARTSYAAKARSAYVRKTAKQVVTRMAEKKRLSVVFNEKALSTLAPGSSGDYVEMTNIAVGTQRNQRVGQQITLKSLELSGQLHNNATPVKVVRMLVGYVTNQSTPLTSFEIFEDDGTAAWTSGPSSNTTLMLYRKINPVKFTVIKDKLFRVGGINGGDSSNTQIYKMRIPLKEKKINFEGDNAASQNQDKRLFVLMLAQRADDDEATGSVVEWTQVATLNYLDI